MKNNKNIILHKKLKATRKSINDLTQIINSLRTATNVSEEDFYNVYLCVYELYVNAVFHGNKIDPSKYVEVILERKDNVLKITVIDQGEGFVLEDVPDPLEKENLLSGNGRGIFIVKNYTKSLKYEHTFRGFNAAITYEIVM